MRAALTVSLVAALAVAGCGTVRESRLNPFNWFGGAVSQPTGTAAPSADGANPLLPSRSPAASLFRRERTEVYAGQPVARIREFIVEQRPGGAILRATAEADRIGPFDVRLVRDEAAPEGVLSYTFRALQRSGPRNAGPDARSVTAARFLTDNDLLGIQRIEVRGRDNVMVSRR